MTLLALRGVDAGYGASQVLFGIDLSIAPGEVVALLGRNGMGKTTLLRTIFGMLPARSGTIALDGKRIDSQPADAIARLGLAWVPEGRQVFPNLTVHEHLVAFAARRNGSERRWSTERIYALFPRLRSRTGALGHELSGGEQQMLAIGRALSTNPRLLLLDEATEGLAPLVREEIWHCLAELKASGLAVLVVDKYVQRLVQIADHQLIVERGRIAWRGSSAQLAADETLWHRYLGV